MKHRQAYDWLTCILPVNPRTFESIVVTVVQLLTQKTTRYLGIPDCHDDK
ncbi:hypothetical protein [Streptococcus dysgalactiae]